MLEDLLMKTAVGSGGQLVAARHLAEGRLSRMLPDSQWARVSLRGQFTYCQISPRLRLVVLSIAGEGGVTRALLQ